MNFRSVLIRRAICRLVMAGFLFAQVIGMAHACVEAAAAPAMAFAQSDHDGDCDNKVNQNACLQQCTAGDQSSAKVQIAVAPLPAVSVLSLPLAPESKIRPAFALLSAAHCPDPPALIRFCSFQL